MAPRPLSPHLSVYRFAYTMALSIFHRATGLALAAGLIVLAAWLLALAGGEDTYSRFQQFSSGWVFPALIALWVIAFVFHFCNGIRHLFWDAGMGLERAQARRSALIVVVLVALLSLLLLYALFSKVYA